jgi:hypothetical protein
VDQDLSITRENPIKLIPKFLEVGVLRPLIKVEKR